VNLVAADSLELTALAALFNEGFSDYVLPMQLDAAALRDHVEQNDIDPAASPVAVADRPVAFALLGRRGADAWIGGMATVPSHRRRGLGERVMAAAIEAAAGHGCTDVWLEVIDGNAPAIALYRRLGFETVRDLVVWSLPASRSQRPPARPADLGTAQAWIAANRADREPWQRADVTLERLRDRRAQMRAMVVERGGATAGAVVYRDEATVTILQAAAVDARAAAEVLRAAAGSERDASFANTPSEGPLAQALRELGASALVRQHEMRLRV
jgi:ribosomal protein S18 acetylase RimI-like enzyme